MVLGYTNSECELGRLSRNRCWGVRGFLRVSTWLFEVMGDAAVWSAVRGEWEKKMFVSNLKLVLNKSEISRNDALKPVVSSRNVQGEWIRSHLRVRRANNIPPHSHPHLTPFFENIHQNKSSTTILGNHPNNQNKLESPPVLTYLFCQQDSPHWKLRCQNWSAIEEGELEIDSGSWRASSVLRPWRHHLAVLEVGKTKE